MEKRLFLIITQKGVVREIILSKYWAIQLMRRKCRIFEFTVLPKGAKRPVIWEEIKTFLPSGRMLYSN